jgi:beta-glucanase (GH16 family)
MSIQKESIAAVLVCFAAACSETMGGPPQPGSGGAGGGVQTGGAAGTGGVVQTGGAAGTGGATGTGGALVGGASGVDGGADVEAGPDVGHDASAVDADADADADAAAADGGADAITDAASVCPGILGHPKADCQYPTYDGFTLKLVEEFDQPLDLATDPNWTYSDGFGDNRYTRYVKQAITFTGGNAVITATGDGVTNPGYPTFAEGELNNFPAVVTGTTTVKSGELRTKYQNWRYGRFEARMKTPNNSNVIGAFFTFRNPKWLEWREIVFEITPANAPTSAGTDLVWGHNAAAFGNASNAYSAKPVPSLADGGTIYDDFHTYAFENLPTKTNWFVDGAQIRQETGTGVKLADMAMKIMFNLWVFPSGSWGGGMAALNVYPMSMQIDWVRLYKSDADTVYPCSPLPSCQPAGDRPFQKNNAEDGLPEAAPW